jgi:hypothetical protein
MFHTTCCFSQENSINQIDSIIENNLAKCSDIMTFRRSSGSRTGNPPALSVNEDTITKKVVILHTEGKRYFYNNDQLIKCTVTQGNYETVSYYFDKSNLIFPRKNEETSIIGKGLIIDGNVHLRDYYRRRTDDRLLWYKSD